MYAAVDKDHVIALHDDIEVVEKYAGNIYKCHNVKLDIIKIKKKALSKITNKDDLYLVRYGRTYIQVGYLLYVQLMSDQIIEDNKYAKDILLRILEMSRLSSKEEKVISKAIDILDRTIFDDETYTPEYKELRRLKSDYDPYIYNYNLFN